MENSHKSERGGGWGLTVSIYGSAIALFIFFAAFVSSHSVYDADHDLVAIERFNPAVTQTLGWAVLAVAIGLLAISLISFARRIVRLPVIGLLIVFILCPFCLLVHIGNNLAPWTVHGRVTTEDGSQYVFCDSSFLQGQIMAIAEVGDAGIFTTSYRVLVVTNGDSPRSWASLIRPADSTDEYGQLYLCKNNFLVGVRYNNHCYLAYDLTNKIPIGAGDVEKLSPFICLSDDDQENDLDVECTMDRIQEHAEFLVTYQDVRNAESFLAGESVPGFPPLVMLQDGLQSDNVAVSSSAKKLLRCYDDALAKIQARVSESKEESDAETEQAEQGGLLRAFPEKDGVQ